MVKSEAPMALATWGPQWYDLPSAGLRCEVGLAVRTASCHAGTTGAPKRA